MSLIIAGVPEHFNLPWILLSEENLNSSWTFKLVREGTGEMTRQLLSQEIDIALMLSEGAMRLNQSHPEYHILGYYTKSPLHWGIHTYPKENRSLETLFQSGKIGISRQGSGSHLMAQFYTYIKGFKSIREDQWVVVNHLEGAIEAFDAQKIDLFLWEKTMTAPFVRQGAMSLQDALIPEWPAFSFIAHKDCIAEKILLFEEALASCILKWEYLLKNRSYLEKEMLKRFSLNSVQVQTWLSYTEIKPYIDLQLDNKYLSLLENAKIL
jgi:sulfonate transport system substrate-binding protein